MTYFKFDFNVKFFSYINVYFKSKDFETVSCKDNDADHREFATKIFNCQLSNFEFFPFKFKML